MHLLLGFLFKISHFWLPVPVEETYLTNGKMGRKDEPELQRWMVEHGDDFREVMIL